MRESLRDRCRDVAARLDRDHPLTKDQMEQVARRMLSEADLPDAYLGWTMVMISSAFWKDSLASVPPERRLFLLPHCLKHAAGCPADYDQFGMNCKECGACSIADFRGLAESMGYRVLVAEGSPVVMKIIVGGYVDAVVGVACLNVLEKAIDKVLLAGIPCMAVPLLSSDCRNTKVDEPWVDEMVRTPYVPAAKTTKTYVHLIRESSRLFDDACLARLAPKTRNARIELALVDSSGEPLPEGEVSINDAVQRADLKTDDDRDESLANQEMRETLTPRHLSNVDPIAATEAIAYDFLARGGKHSRPFITLAAYDAMQGGDCVGKEGQTFAKNLPDAVRRAALSIETFHKASLVHDDIEDDDAYRYGKPAVHHQFGVASAINVGDYLIGLGYRLLSRSVIGDDVNAETRVDLLDSLAAAHVRLSEGQGAELTWRDRNNRELTPLDALKIYALKTSPAFEAALYSGVRLGMSSDDSAESLVEPIRKFSRNLGVAFQIINDINDWVGDDVNKCTAGGDVIAGRPTLLWALALQELPQADRDELMSLIPSEDNDSSGVLSDHRRLQIARRLYDRAGVFELALQLVDKHQARAEAIADAVEPVELRRLLYYLVDTVLQRPELPAPTVVALGT
ncbi:MAG: polyprenyl synthetase family protein [Planctomycetota bacterium]